MTLPTPVLDDRTFEQIRDELLARIPVYTPEWTDRGPSDPGVTLLELVAYLGESLLFRFNQIPDQTRLWLLSLLQLPPHPPRRATGLVAFAPVRTAGPPAVVAAGDALADDAGTPFRVGNDVTVLPVTVTAVVKAAADVPVDPILTEEYQRVLDAAGLDQDEARPYEERPLDPDPGAPGFRPLTVDEAVDRSLWVAVHGADDQRTALFGAAGVLGRTPLVLGIGTAAGRPTLDQARPCVPAAEGPESHRVAGPAGRPDSTLVWQVSARRADDLVGTDYLPVAVVRDTTDGLRRDGVVALQLPAAELERIGVGELDDPELAGVRDDPPALADGPPVLFWLRAFPRQGVPEIGALRWVGVNAADVEQVADAAPELLGTGDGLSGQELFLAHVPVVPGTLRVEVQEGGEWRAWAVVDSFAASAAADRHLVLDPASGRVRSGDSVRGMVLPSGALVRAAGYRHGGGRVGSVPAGSISRVVTGPDVTVVQPLPTTGGEEGETLARALERIPGELTRRDRAVTTEDFRELARIAGVGRAECLPRFDPVSKSFDAAGVVTVMIWPAEDPLHPDAPSADVTLIGAVCRHLDQRRLVTTELYVVPPAYRRVAVSAGIAVKPGYSAAGVRRWVELVLRQYLAPLPPYGPDGTGWPLGHRVHAPELQAAVLQVEGVDFIEELKVADLASGTAVPGTVELAGWEVPELSEVTVVLGPPPDPGSGPPAPSGPAPVPVPVPKDEC